MASPLKTALKHAIRQYLGIHKIMAAIDDLQANVSALDAKVDLLNGKNDVLISLVGTLRDQIAALQAAGGATVEQLEALSATITATMVKIDEQVAEDDAALTPP
jgi:peptidoglycan hydrolase CwlO-like protein